MLPWAIALALVALAVLARELIFAKGRRPPVTVAGGGGPV
jgi:hypothetical protein